MAVLMFLALFIGVLAIVVFMVCLMERYDTFAGFVFLVVICIGLPAVAFL